MEGTMHCPNCGMKAALNQKYCRSCGFSLEKFSQMFEEQSPDREAPELEAGQLEDLQAQRRKIERLRNIVFTALLTGVLGYILGYSVTYRLMVDEDSFLVGILLGLVILGAIAVIWLSLWAEDLRKTTAEWKQIQPGVTTENPPASETSSNLQIADYHETPRSVIENTTRLLDPALAAEEKLER